MTTSRSNFEGDNVRYGMLVAALGCAAMVLAGAARAAEDSAGKKDPSLEEARQHAARAKVHYDLGEFEKAAEEYIIVYRLRPLPALLFNIAQSYRGAGLYEKAKQFYRAYLRENPDSQTRAAVKKALKEIDELLAKERKTREAPPVHACARTAPAGCLHPGPSGRGGGGASAGADPTFAARSRVRGVAAHAGRSSSICAAGADRYCGRRPGGTFLLPAHMDLLARRRLGGDAGRRAHLCRQGEERRQRADRASAHDRGGG